MKYSKIQISNISPLLNEKCAFFFTTRVISHKYCPIQASSKDTIRGALSRNKNKEEETMNILSYTDRYKKNILKML